MRRDWGNGEWGMGDWGMGDWEMGNGFSDMFKEMIYRPEGLTQL